MDMAQLSVRAGQISAFRANEAARAGTRQRIARALVRGLFRLLFRVRSLGEIPRSGPYLLVANHQGWADPFLLIALLPAEPRLYFIGDLHGANRLWWKRLVLRWLGGVVGVQRDGTSERAAIEIVLSLLEQGAPVCIFAEGKISGAEAQLARFQRGVGYLAVKARVPVMPVWLRGTAELYLGRELVAVFGAACAAPDVAPTRQATSAFATELHDRVAALATPWVEPEGVSKRWRWLTHLL